jgi:hypothetical protein
VEIGLFGYFCKLKKPKLTMRSFYLLLCLLVISQLSFGQTITSAGTGFWDVPGTWVGGVVPTNANSTLVSIGAGHIITIRDSESAQSISIPTNINSRVVVSSIGQLNVSGTFTLGTTANRGRVEVAGILQMNDGSTIVNGAQQRLIIQSGGTYRMNYSTNGVIYDGDFQSGSTLEFSGYTDPSAIAPTLAVSPKSFHHVLWNCTSQGNDIDLDGILSTINGNLSITSTGSDFWFLLLSDGVAVNRTITVGGNFLVSNDSYVYLSGYSGGANVTMNITGNANVNIDPGYAFVLSGSSGIGTLNVNGDFGINSSSASIFMTESSGSGILNVMGNFSLTSGTLNNAGSGSAAINFNGATTNTFTNTGTISASINYTIASLKTLNLGASALTGTGGITLNGTIGLGSTDAGGALQTGTSGGNIRVSGTRTYASGSTIVYNGTGGQFIGNGFPSGGDVNLVINNSSNVTLSTSLDIVALRTLTLTSGNIVIGTQTLTINGTITGAGGVVGGPLSNIIIGGTGAFGTLNFNGTNQLLNFTMDRGAGSVNLGGDLEILGTFTHTDGALVLGSNTLTISGNYGRSFGTLAVTSLSSVIISGSGTLPSGSAGISGSTLGTLTLNRASSTLDVSASVAITNLNLISGILNNGAGLSITTGGTITRNEQGSMTTVPNNTTNAYNVVYSITSSISTGPELPVNTNTTALANFTKTGTGALTLSGDITVNGIFTLNDGSFNAGSNDIDIKGNFVNNAAATLTASNFTFSGTTTISGSTIPTFGNITISGSGTLTPAATFSVNGNLVNNGTLNAGSATTIFGGTTVISGSSICSFNNISITGSLTAPTGNMNVAGNWNNTGTFVNGANTNTVTFNGTTAFTGAGLTQFSGITISGTGTLTSSPTLRVAGNFTNNGTFNSNSGTLLLNGSSLQLLQGSTLTNFNNISITNVGGPPGVRVVSDQDISGVLTLASNVTFDPDGVSGSVVFRLRSTADNPTVDASIASLPSGASVQGSVTVQRYMSIEGGNSGRIYRYISSPVQSAPVSQIQAFIPVTGTFTGASSCSGCGTNQTMFTYNEADITGDLNTGYVNFPATVNSETFTEGLGYSIFVRGNIAPVSTAGSALYELRGPIFSGNRTLPVTFNSSGTLANDGWNLVGNPYPSTIDWQAASGWTKTNMTDAIYVNDNGNGTIASFINGTGVNGGSRYISSGQGFFVKSSGGVPVLQTTEAVKVGGTQTTFLREGAVPNLLKLKLTKGNIYDEIAIRYSSEATDSFDPTFDAYKLKNAAFNFSSIIGDVKYSINSLNEFSCSSLVQLDISDAAVGAYKIELSQFDSFDESIEISLIDQFTGTTIDARTQSVYDFTISDDANSTGNRFKIMFAESAADSSIVPEGATSLCVGSEYSIILPSSESNVSYYASLNGTIISDQVVGSGSNVAIGIDESKLSNGSNTIMVFAKKATCDATPLLESVQVNVDRLYAISSTTDGQSCQSGSVTLEAAGAPTNGSYNWYESMDSIEPISGTSGNVFQSPVLNKSRSYYVAAVNSLGCEGEREEIKAEVLQYDEVVISEPEYGVLKSTYATGNVWFYNDKVIEGANDQSITVDQSGVYKVEVTVGSCKSVDTYEYVVTGIETNLNRINIYPNPVSSELVVNVAGKKIESVNLISNVGVKLKTVQVGNVDKDVVIDMRSCPTGLYIIKVIGIDKSISTYKIIKQ